MGGKEAAVQIRRSGVLTPFIAFTANVMKYQVDAYKSIGFDRIIEKPIAQSSLYDTLNQYLKKQNGNGEQQKITVLIVAAASQCH